MNEIRTVTAINVYFAVAILFLVLSAAIIYFYPSNQTTESNASSTQERTVTSDAEKYQILNQLS